MDGQTPKLDVHAKPAVGEWHLVVLEVVFVLDHLLHLCEGFGLVTFDELACVDAPELGGSLAVVGEDVPFVPEEMVLSDLG